MATTTSLLPHYELSLLQRISLIWLFILCGLVVSFQLSQHYAERPAAWVRLNKETKPYWYTFYVFEAFLLVQISHGVLMFNLEGLLGGIEEDVLNGLWIGLLGLEALMVTGVALRGLFRAIAPKAKQKAL